MAGLRIAGAADASGAQLIDGVRIPTEIDLRLVAELLPYAQNSRKHSPAQVEALARSMQAVGFTNPLLVAEGTIVAGHGRLMAAKKLGLTRVPCIDVSHLNADERRALVIWDNRSQEIGGGYDLDMLKLETDYLRDVGMDLEEVTGFSEESLAELFAGMEPDLEPGGGDPDDAPGLPDEPVSQMGDVWVMGPHKLYIGDSTDPASWDALLAGESVDLVFVDPPYNVDVGAKNGRQDKADGGSRAASGRIKNDKMSDAAFADFMGAAYSALMSIMKPGATIYVAHSDKAGGIFRQEFEKAGFRFSQNIIWRKNQLVLGMSRYQPIHEPILMGQKPGSKSAWYGGRKQTTVMDFGDNGPFTRLEDGRWQIKIGDSVMVVDGSATVEEHPTTFLSVPKPAKSGLHPTTKPVALIERLLRNSARRGDLVADGFGGSGSTLIAADRMGMYARLIEYDEGYADVIVTRWQQLTGRRAVHAVTGEPFPASSGERAPSPPPQEAAPDNGDPF